MEKTEVFKLSRGRIIEIQPLLGGYVVAYGVPGVLMNNLAAFKPEAANGLLRDAEAPIRACPNCGHFDLLGAPCTKCLTSGGL